MVRLTRPLAHLYRTVRHLGFFCGLDFSILSQLCKEHCDQLFGLEPVFIILVPNRNLNESVLIFSHSITDEFLFVPAAAGESIMLCRGLQTRETLWLPRARRGATTGATTHFNASESSLTPTKRFRQPTVFFQLRMARSLAFSPMWRCLSPKETMEAVSRLLTFKGAMYVLQY